MIPSLERWPTKAKEAPSPHEVRLAPLDTNPVFENLGDNNNNNNNNNNNKYGLEVSPDQITTVLPFELLHLFPIPLHLQPLLHFYYLDCCDYFSELS